MDNKQEIVEQIKEWVRLDAEIAQLKAEVKQRNQRTKDISAWLIETMKQYNIDEFKLSGEKIVRQTRKTKKPLSRKHLMECLTKFYEDTPDTAEELTKSIMDSREEKINETIRKKHLPTG
jgi:hypothetical protein